jgi:hypothetical protein
MAEFGAYQVEASRLSASEQAELLWLLSSCEPRAIGMLGESTRNRRVRRALEFYRPISKVEEAQIWKFQSTEGKTASDNEGPPEDELVEDAGLHEEPLETVEHPKSGHKGNVRRVRVA